MPLVCIVDDDAAARSALSAVVEAAGHHVAAFSSGEALLSAGSSANAACVLADMCLRGMNGLNLLCRLKAHGLKVPVILLTGFGGISLAVEAMKCGAFDFIEKPVGAATMLAVVERAIAQSAPSPVSDIDLHEVTVRFQGLTPRERDLLHHLMTGRTNKVIAQELQISPRTVELHRSHLMRKMAASSVPHLVRMAMSAGIIDPQN